MRALLEEGVALYRDALKSMHTVGNREGVSHALEGLAATAEPELAVKLLGVAGALREEIGAPLVPPEHAIHERTVASLRSTLGEVGLDALAAASREFDLEAVISALD